MTLWTAATRAYNGGAAVAIAGVTGDTPSDATACTAASAAQINSILVVHLDPSLEV
ncbi:hypothetical protein [Microbacterium natoriense]|uniref:hypothetical protein n=1 Tax=Microbacterium natoriense TaxID=284570 RepID=UPI0027D82E1F|nr:hypothetical protein [Microbacterium natoriense]